MLLRGPDPAGAQPGGWLRRRSGAPLAGEHRPAPNGTSWAFVPSQPWQESALAITLWPRLADLAGNELGRLFDRALGAPAAALATRLPFLPRR